jgi:adenine-specific DNA methylase
VVCAGCGAVARQDKGRTRRRCPCGTTTAVREGTLRYGVATCPGCGEKERLIDQARRTGRPRFRLFAVESIPVGTGGRPVPIAERILHAASAADQARYARAGAELADLANLLPSRAIPVDGRSDDRLTDYGYRRYVELFNARQQLHLARLLLALPQADPDHRPALALALSNHLTANCMLTRYAARWRQVTPLFALRAYVHSPRPVELNPWLHATGRGTYPNAVRKVAQAIVYARKPREFAAGGFTPVPAIPSRTTPVVVHGDSRHRPEIADGSVHIVLTDPPYLDNIDYGELSDFYLPWLAAVGLTDDPGGPSAASLAAKGRGPSDAASFTEGLNACFREAARILHPGGRMIFTFQHQTAAAWEALGVAMHRSGLHAVTVLPLRGDGEAGLHRHEGSSTWDAVLVLRHPGPADGAGTRASGTAPAQGNTLARPPVLQDAEHLARCLAHADTWADRLALGAPDRLNLRRACIVAGVVGLHADPTGTSEATLVGLAKGLAASNPERAAAG